MMGLGTGLEDVISRAKGIAFDSREVKGGYVFFAVKGTRFDGHDFVKDALERGAELAVVEREIEGVDEGRILVVEDTRKALGEASSLFFGNPSSHLSVIGITGTNGKTTTAHIIEGILLSAGFSCGVIGTVSYRIGRKVIGEGTTTPDPISWHRSLMKMAEEGAEYVVAEISSHALDQRRIWGTRFTATLFTNLTQDHLDYHKTMENYFLAKRRLFTEYQSSIKVINADDDYGKRLAREVEDSVTVGKNGILSVVDFKTGFEGSEILLEWKGKRFHFKTNLIGDFQKTNLSLAVATALSLEIPPGTIAKGIERVEVPGRFEVYSSQRGFLVVVDYAHTPDAIDNVLRTIRRIARGRVITVFGAGGDRDRGKRPLMGKAARRWSDLVILTSDNPRSEDPDLIIEDILTAFGGDDRVLREPDRRKAIETAIKSAKDGDVVAVLGKGHEEYQEVQGVKYPFSDREVVRELI